MTPVAVRLMRDLRSAGWQHSVESVYRGGYDRDGAPNSDDDTRHHWWRRESETIELVFSPEFEPSVSWNPRGDEGWDMDDITALCRWLEPERLPALRDVAAALGILTPPVIAEHPDSMGGRCGWSATHSVTSECPEGHVISRTVSR